MEKHRDLVDRRDDFSIELCALYNQSGGTARPWRFYLAAPLQPVGRRARRQALAQHVRTQLSLGRRALRRGAAAEPAAHFEAALASPENLGEAKHLLANQSDIYYWLGTVRAALKAKPRREVLACRGHVCGDFQQ